jgi:phage tail protein X
MTNRAKLWMLAILIGVVWLATFALSQFPAFVDWYSRHLYPSLQCGRQWLFTLIPFSVGDVLYILLGAWLLVTVVRWVYFMRKFGSHKDKLWGSVLNTINAALILYFLFLLGWGANYNKPPLAKSWNLPARHKGDRRQRRAADMADAVAFSRFLVPKLNAYAPQYRTLPYEHIHQRAIAYYREFTDSRVKSNGFYIKSTLYTVVMQYMGVDGYYNPFTGEGQVLKEIPAYTLPFILCHEMAHQAGIAAEGDANLMAYALCTNSNDPVFRYSGYLDLWLYANTRLYRYDSALANTFTSQLNPLTRAHLDTLDELSRKYQGATSRATSEIYDSYLRMQHQEQGIRSYGNVMREAWLLEQRRAQQHGLIHIP